VAFNIYKDVSKSIMDLTSYRRPVIYLLLGTDFASQDS